MVVPVRFGVVSEFDDEVGLGTVRTADGAEYRFHCVEIADGTRTIEVGTRVMFTARAKLGIDEAAAITATPPAS